MQLTSNEPRSSDKIGSLCIFYNKYFLNSEKKNLASDLSIRSQNILFASALLKCELKN